MTQFPPVPGGTYFARSANTIYVIPPSGDPTGAADAASILAAVSALPADGGTVTLGPGQWHLVPGAVVIRPGDAQTIVIDGQWGAVVNAVAGTAGDVIRMYNPNTQGSSEIAFSQRSGITRVTFDGTSAAAGSSAVHMGDLMVPQLDVIIQNFSGAASIGLHLENTVSWTEEYDFRAVLINCTRHVVYEVSTGYDSFDYGSADYTILASPGQDGVVVLNGASPDFASLRIRGNFTAGSGANSGKVLRLTGSAPGGSPSAGQNSSLFGTTLDIKAESDGAGGFPAQTIFLDTGCYIQQCSGMMTFNNSMVPCNIVLATSSTAYQFQGWGGTILGDASLNPGGAWTTAGALLYTEGPSPVFSGISYVDLAGGDMYAVVLGANTTVNMAGGGSQAGPQRKTFFFSQPAAGGTYNYTVTWPHPGSPTLNSPTVKWAGGTAPTMTTGAGATDVYKLETIDGVTWYGQAIQNLS